MEKRDRIRNFARLVGDYTSLHHGQVLGGVVSEGNLEGFMENCRINNSQCPAPPHKPDIYAETSKIRWLLSCYDKS